MPHIKQPPSHDWESKNYLTESTQLVQVDQHTATLQNPLDNSLTDIDKVVVIRLMDAFSLITKEDCHEALRQLPYTNPTFTLTRHS